MKKVSQNRFIREVKEVAGNNPNVDIALSRKWQEVVQTLEKMVPPEPEKKLRLKDLVCSQFR